MTPAPGARAEKKDVNALTLDDLSAVPFACVNCFRVLDVPKAFCAQLCADEAAWVRYARRNRAGATPDVEQAIRIRLALILGGGYDKAGRHLSPARRAEVIARDGGRCCMCGEPGSEIDHISGSSDALENLQLLCDRCHNKKTVAAFVRITRESHPDAWEKVQRLKRRAAASRPLQLCDSEEWVTLHKELLRRRRDLARNSVGSLFD